MSTSLYSHNEANNPYTPKRYAVGLAGDLPDTPITWADTKPTEGNQRYQFPFNHEKELKELRRKIK
jgi:hypothetical protein